MKSGWDDGSARHTKPKRKTSKTRTVYFRVPQRLHDEIHAESQAVGLCMADIVRRILEDRYNLRLLNLHHADGPSI